MVASTVSQVTDAVTYLGEAPVWVPEWGGLHIVDMLAGDVLAVDEATGAVVRHHVGTVAAVVRPRTNGGAVLALEHSFALLDPPPAGVGGSPFGPEDDITSLLRPVGDLSSFPALGLRLNDGGCDPDGRFYCDSVAKDITPGGAGIFRLDPDGSVTVAATNVTVGNGLAWSPDGTRAYFVDTVTRRIDVFDYSLETGLTGRRPWVTVADGPGIPDATTEVDAETWTAGLSATGIPDGLTVDAEGGVWVALWQSGNVCRYAPDGTCSAVVSLPVPGVTACAFGGPDLATLYVTTSKMYADVTSHPASGAVFAVDAGVRGLPVSRFAG